MTALILALALNPNPALLASDLLTRAAELVNGSGYLWELVASLVRVRIRGT